MWGFHLGARSRNGADDVYARGGLGIEMESHMNRASNVLVSPHHGGPLLAEGVGIERRRVGRLVPRGRQRERLRVWSRRGCRRAIPIEDQERLPAHTQTTAIAPPPLLRLRNRPKECKARCPYAALRRDTTPRARASAPARAPARPARAQATAHSSATPNVARHAAAKSASGMTGSRRLRYGRLCVYPAGRRGRQPPCTPGSQC